MRGIFDTKANSGYDDEVTRDPPQHVAGGFYG